MDGTSRGAADSEPSCDEVRAALERALASSQFSKASQRCQFLRFVVAETLQGRGADLKEYSIGAALKGPFFDGDTDTTVRVQAANIRRKLAEYYEGPGADDPLIIEIPKPGYVPVFRYRSTAARDNPTQIAARPAWRPLALMLAGVGVLLAIAVAIVFRSRGPADSVRESLRLVQITHDPGRTGNPAVSRDGRLLAFDSDRDEPGVFDIYIRELASGDTRRLTHDPEGAATPDISPDSRSVVFRSTRGTVGGIFVIPVAGGIETRIADGGYSPRFSPDGAWIAFSRNAKIYVAPAQGGPSRRVQSQAIDCSCPLWTPDGKAIQFVAKDNGRKDWWLAPFDPSADHPVPATSRGLLAALRRQRTYDQDYLCDRDWLNNDLMLASGGSLLRVGTNPGDWSVKGPITQILPAVGASALRVVRGTSGRARVFFTSSHDQTRIWGVPLAGNLTESRGELRLLADEAASRGVLGSRPSLSSDGRFLVFSNGVDPANRVLLYDLKAGTKTRLNPVGTAADRGVISRDGEAVAWQQELDGRKAIYAVRTMEPARARRICGDCGEPLSWSPNRESLLFLRDAGLLLLDVEDGSTRVLLKRGPYEVFQASFSPEGRRIALVVGIPGRDKVQGYVSRFDGTVGADSSWTLIAEASYELSMEWAPEGDVIYYFNKRDGSRCLWAQKLDRSGLPPAGEPVAIRHIHRQRRYPLYGSWIATARDLIAVTLTESLANLYRVELP